MRTSFKKISFLVLAVLFFSGKLYGKHIVGGDMSVRWVSGNTFEITMNFFRDCSSTTIFDPTIKVGVFDKVTNDTIGSITISNPVLSKVTLGDNCYDPQMCMEKAVYKTTVVLPNNAAGYYISYHRCCRNGVISNIVNPDIAGYVMYCEIPNPALHNSNPVFKNVPDGYMCINYPNTDDFSCTDADGDSLVYSFIDPLSCSSNVNKICDDGLNADPGIAAKPYGNITWASGFGVPNQMGDPNMSIGKSTGIVTTTPPLKGVYVFCIRVEEYRNKIKIGEIRRDFQFATLPCWILYANFNPNPVICAGKTATLTAMGAPAGFVYSWAPGGQTTSSIVVSHAVNGSYGYTVTATDYTCTATATATITVNENPVQSVITGNPVACFGNNSGTAIINPAGGASPYTFQWGTNPVQTTSVATGLTSGTYSAVITDAKGCTSTETVSITQPNSALSISGTTSNSVLCYGNSSGSASVSPIGGTSPYTYSWNNNPTLTTASITGLPAGTYSATITDAKGCIAKSVLVITQPNAALSLSTSSAGFSCAGTSPNGSVSSSASGGTVPYSYLWMPGNKTSPSLNNLKAGTYSLTLTDANGCKSFSTATINTSTKPDAIFSYSSDAACNGFVLNFKDESTPSGIASWDWNFGNGNFNNSQNPSYTFPFNSGTHNVSLIVSLPPCKDTTQHTIQINDLSSYFEFDAANVFTPNDDKLNDCFLPVLKENGAGVSKLKDCISIEVYDRWGVKMFESPDNGVNCWNGNNKQNNKPAVDGVYFYVAKLAMKTIKGSITLIRNKP